MKNAKPFHLSNFPLTGVLFLALLTFGFSGSQPAFGAGFQIPNQSLKAIGSAGANIAFTPGPDSAYYNPANMSFLEDRWQAETSLTTLWLPEVEYTDNRSALFDGSSDSEVFFMPQVHVSSRNYNDFHFGFSLTYPYGLAKSWDQPYPAATTRLFSLFVVEANTSLSYSVCDNFSIAAGLRAIYGEGEVENGITNPPFIGLAPLTSLSRKMDGDDLELGYNLAVTVKPTPSWRLAATYRSEVDLDLAGDAELLALAGGFPLAGYDGAGALSLTLPAVFSLATSYSFGDLTLEMAWSRTFWSEIESLDFRYDQSFLGTLFDGFDRAVVKNWDDSDALRFGLSYQLSRQLLTTAGFAIDDTPVPEHSLGFELPDSDGYMYGLGLLYTRNDRLKLGVSYMYYHTTSRNVTNTQAAGLPGIDGSFDKGGAHALTLGLITSF
jgi:long-chain fatty acid transport protein